MLSNVMNMLGILHSIPISKRYCDISCDCIVVHHHYVNIIAQTYNQPFMSKSSCKAFSLTLHHNGNGFNHV